MDYMDGGYNDGGFLKKRPIRKKKAKTLVREPDVSIPVAKPEPEEPEVLDWET